MDHDGMAECPSQTLRPSVKVLTRPSASPYSFNCQRIRSGLGLRSPLVVAIEYRQYRAFAAGTAKAGFSPRLHQIRQVPYVVATQTQQTHKVAGSARILCRWR